MAKVIAETEIDASLADVWDRFVDTDTWSRWVGGFSRIAEVDGYPEEGGRVIWQSNELGRGRVAEKVLECEQRSRLLVEFEDPEMHGQIETKFEILSTGDGSFKTKVAQVWTYKLNGAGPFRLITDWAFIRPQMRRAVERSLRAFRAEACEDLPPASG